MPLRPIQIYVKARDQFLALPPWQRAVTKAAIRELGNPEFHDREGHHRDSSPLAGLSDTRCLIRANCGIYYREAEAIRVIRIEKARS